MTEDRATQIEERRLKRWIESRRFRTIPPKPELSRLHRLALACPVGDAQTTYLNAGAVAYSILHREVAPKQIEQLKLSLTQLCDAIERGDRSEALAQASEVCWVAGLLGAQPDPGAPRGRGRRKGATSFVLDEDRAREYFVRMQAGEPELNIWNDMLTRKHGKPAIEGGASDATKKRRILAVARSLGLLG